MTIDYCVHLPQWRWQLKRCISHIGSEVNEININCQRHTKTDGSHFRHSKGYKFAQLFYKLTGLIVSCFGCQVFEI